jgi:hypothetical protein
MKLWIDDVRPAPEGYTWCKSVNDAKLTILKVEQSRDMALAEAQFKIKHSIKEYQRMLIIASRREIELIDIDHDAGDFSSEGGDYIKLLDWLEETSRNYPIHIHSMNPVGGENMRRIIQRNGWEEV